MHDDLQKIIEFRHDAPFRALGWHRRPNDSGNIVIRAFIPDALEVSAFIERPIKEVVRMQKLHPAGLFETQIALKDSGHGVDYVLRVTDAQHRCSEIRDAYSYVPDALDPEEEARFSAGEHNRLFQRLGAHPESRNAVTGVRFGIWAPKAQRISVVGNFNRWDGRRYPMQRIGKNGLWELFIPDVKNGDFYKFEIRAQNGDVFLKTDPYALRIENSAEAAAIVCDPQFAPRWSDGERRRETENRSPRVFKLDAEQRTDSGGLIATDDELVKLKAQGYSHIEIPVPWNETNGIAAFFAPHPRLGTPEQLSSWIDRCHRHDLGVIVAALPLRLAAAQKNLGYFDGGPLYEKADKQDVFRFDSDNPGVKNFLRSHARFWQEVYRIDGFRLDSESYTFHRRSSAADATEHSGLLLLVYDTDAALALPHDSIERLLRNRRHMDPFAVLGPHRQSGQNTASVRAILPPARQAYVHFPEQPDVWYEMRPCGGETLWQALIPPEREKMPYRLHTIDADGNRDDFPDSYAFDVSYLSPEDKALFAAGKHYRIYDILGAHPKAVAGTAGVGFAVWAPNAAAVNLVGDFNRWHGSGHPLRFYPECGIWELFVPGIGNGELYKFEIIPQHGASFLKSDPYAFFMETAPATASVVYAIDAGYQWHDQDWLLQRRSADAWRTPVSIYEVHLGSWMRGPGNRHLSYTELAERLIPYVKDMGFTHIEILPVAEHPYEPSWGYQVSNFYAPTSRLGKPEELMAFVDRCHQNGIGVLLDWVPGHFPKDAHALAKFDGTHLYEHADPRKGEHKDWGTLIFNYGRHETENFLIANALFWLEHYHFDGLRVDAVASMLYLDYSRQAGEWIPNQYGGHENLEAIAFLKHTNVIVHDKFPGVMMIAEESTAWPGVSRPTDAGGLGFGFKWNMGWMHDVLDYLQTPPEFRPYHHHRLTFVFHYAFEENFILSLSHDEVVHLKGSLYAKMPGSAWEKFANLRLLFFFMFTHPGKKLNFMGAEFAQSEEWSESHALQWQLIDNEPNRLLQTFFKTLNRLYRNEPVLYEMDCRAAGFEWIDADNREQSIIVYSRKARDPRIAMIAVINFSAISRCDYRIGVPYPVTYTRVIDSNDIRFGGLSSAEPDTVYSVDDIPWHGQEFSISIDKLPALSALLLRPAAPDL
ncbi:MAG: 1,4-alpha-glucan branching protein GlgB [Gammaproteobacteria bacterium]